MKIGRQALSILVFPLLVCASLSLVARRASWKATFGSAVKSPVEPHPDPSDRLFPRLRVGAPPPDWPLFDRDGHEYRLSHFRGCTVLLAFFRDSPPCIRLAPQWEKFHREAPDVILLGISTNAPGDISRFRQATRVTFPLLFDQDYDRDRLDTFLPSPSTAVINEDGIVASLCSPAGNAQHAAGALSSAIPPRVRSLQHGGGPQADAALAVHDSTPRYTIRDLGPANSRFSAAFAINARGQVAGYSFPSEGHPYASHWREGTWQALPPLRERPAWAYGLNDAGQVVGRAQMAGRAYHAFLCSNGSLEDVGTLGGLLSTAWAINNAGDVVGESTTAGRASTHAFLYHDGVMKDLGTLGGSDSEAHGINSNGQVVGASQTRYDWSTHAFLYSGARMEDLGTLGGGDSEARAISDAGQVVGWADVADGAEHAFLYCDSALKDLGTLGGLSSVAEGINSSGQVVGCWRTHDGTRRAFLYTDGRMYDLDAVLSTTSGWHLQAAQAINDRGQIVASGVYRGRAHALLLTPTQDRSPNVLRAPIRAAAQ